MTERQEKLSARLAKVRKNIEDSRRLIAYHKKMLKIYKRKEKELSDRLEKEQLNDLFKTVKDKGCDIEAINFAINNGEFTAETADASGENVSPENTYHQPTLADISGKNKEDNKHEV